MKTIFILFFLFLSITSCISQSKKMSENDWSDYIQKLIGGQREYSVESGRVDLLTEEFSFEVEWANKWKNSIGQSLWYALQTNKKPGIILLIRSEKDYKYFIQLNSALSYAKLDEKIKVLLFPNDFEELIKKKPKGG